MPEPSRRALELAERFDLALPERQLRGPIGERLARGTGSSLEFQDRRAYAPGDDVRHLDWRTYGRTGELQVKLYREEILPRVDLILDASCSMRVGRGKESLAVDLAVMIARGARRGGVSARLVALREAAQELDLQRFVQDGLELDTPVTLAGALEGLETQLRAGSFRVLISDLLAPVDPARVVGRLAARAAGVRVLQVLAPEDLRPTAGVAARLVDAESGALRDLVLDAPTVERYLGRLRRLGDAWRGACARHRAGFVTLDSGLGLEVLCRGELASAGVLVPAASPG